MAEQTQETEMTPGGVALTFERWHAEFRALLEEHRRDIQARLERIEKDTDRDYFMSAEEAKNYGIVDNVITNRMEIPKS